MKTNMERLDILKTCIYIQRLLQRPELNQSLYLSYFHVLFQLSNSPTTSPPGSPGRHLTPRRLAPTDSEDQDSSGSEENSFSCIPSVDGWEMVPRDVHRKLKGQEFLHRLQVSMRGEVTKNEM